MFGKNNGQIDVFTNMIYEKLIPRDHLLVKIDSIIDFSFVYELVKDTYSDAGRKSCDAVVLFKLCLLEFIYNTSDVQIVKKAQTDVVFRWFLGLNLDDVIPDDTTICYFRKHRLGSCGLELIFNNIVEKCIEYNLVKKRRYMIDSTDVAANVNYPSMRKLICDSFRKVTREISKFNEKLAKKELDEFEKEIDFEYEKSDKVSVVRYSEIAKKHAEYIYLETYDELQSNVRYRETFSVFWDIVEQYLNSNSNDRIISCVDPDARVAHKSPGNKKRGYKDHIIVDEDSEIIIASTQTPFNVNDGKELQNLVEKTKENFNIKPQEISADKAYGAVINRGYLIDEKIMTNIQFDEESDKENKYFGIDDFKISEDLKCATCPNNIQTNNCKLTYSKQRDLNEIVFYFKKATCDKCKFRSECFSTNIKAGKSVKIPERYDAIVRDKEYNKTPGFVEAINKRYKIERRFATMVRNHGLRRSRYLRIEGAKIHITLANIACNIVRMVNLLCNQPSFAMRKIS